MNINNNLGIALSNLSYQLDGDLRSDNLHKIIYSTDASAYSEQPLVVIYPKSELDISKVIHFAKDHKQTIICRAAGTSLAGQVVGKGIILDVSKYLRGILEINLKESWVRVEPGVVLDELNIFLQPHGLFFGPETSTSNRCCIGGMLGNNSCGSHSLAYGSTRDHLLEAKLLLSDASSVVFRELSEGELLLKLQSEGLESDIYRHIYGIVSDKETLKSIADNFPDKALTRRNTGYALDQLHLHKLNLCKLFAGSEGTLGIATEIKLSLVKLPPKHKALVCYHCDSLEESFTANLVALKHKPVAVELIDHNIIELSANNIEQERNRFFIKGQPAAILLVELALESNSDLDKAVEQLSEDFISSGFSGYCSIVKGSDISKVWSLRKAGLGLLSSMPGSAKPVSVVEDTAVLPSLLPAYIKEFSAMMSSYGLSCVYHAHIGSGELHLRPILDLKKASDKKLFRIIAHDTALLVKKYRGSLSGEHGDGRLRGEFIPLIFGPKVYGLMRDVKYVFDPSGVFNANKIVDTPAMNTSLRYDGDYSDIKVDTYFDFSAQKGWLSAIEQCNGSGDCRKSDLFGGSMCPSYRATGNEKDTTRARANVLRDMLSRKQGIKKFSQPEILQALDLCVSCKACKSECPSNVDMARLKAEFMQHYYDENPLSIKVWLVANLPTFQSIFTHMPFLYNFVVENKLSSFLLKKLLYFSSERSLPPLSRYSLRKLANKISKQKNTEYTNGQIYLFADEFTSYMESDIGVKFIKLMNALSYQVIIPKHKESGRTALSKGLVRKAKQIANANVHLLAPLVSADIPLVGIEPSCILSFRDEYPDLVDANLKAQAQQLSSHSLLFDEFIIGEMKKGKINSSSFVSSQAKIFLHGHCHQKALASVKASADILSLPVNYKVVIIPSGCCGMAGAFGYEKNHYEISMIMGEKVLFPFVRKAADNVIVVAPGTSCRQQIFDGTGRKAIHPIEVLYNALAK